MPERTKWYKAATTKLSGPHHGGLTYTPGSHHEIPLESFDPEPHGWCTAGLYVTSHRRVAARWGPVVMEVHKPAGCPLVKTTRTHRPTGVPPNVDSGTYAKYRTTKLDIIRIIGVTAYGYDRSASFQRAAILVDELNYTLHKLGKQPVVLTGNSLERLRHDGYQLWEVTEIALPTEKHFRIEITVKTPPSMVTGGIVSQVWDTLGDAFYNQGGDIEIESVRAVE